MALRSFIACFALHGTLAYPKAHINKKVLKTLQDDEASAYTYFLKGTPYGTPMEVPRYSNLTMGTFEDLALSGRPFIVTDGGKEQPFVGWTCDRFAKEYPTGVVKVEYVKGIKATWKITDNWQKEKHPIPNADPGGPQYAPWYWGVKGADEPGEAKTIYTGKKSPLPQVQKSMRLPPFMRVNSENKQEVLGSPEFWFSMPGAGATMHMDGHCESTFAIQLKGKRKWRIGWVPPVPNGTIYKNGVYADGAIYGKKYQPPLEATVSEGEAFYMPSAFLHETQNVGDGCAVSLTFQFKDPTPARYFRHSLRHLRRTGDFEECFETLAMVAGLGSKKGKKTPPMSKVDKDGNGVFTLQEANTRILRASHAFYDTDSDGVVKAEELEAGWSAYMEADKEAKTGKAKKPKDFSYVKKPRSQQEDGETDEQAEL